MGTSTSQRSPATREWDLVRELYQQPNPSPGEVVGRIVEALDEAARRRLHDAASVRCLDAVLHGSAALAQPGAALPVAEPSTGVPALDLAGSLRAAAQESIARDRVASLTGSLALDAIIPTVLESLGPTPTWTEFPAETVVSLYARYAHERDLAGLVGQFCGHDFDRVFRYYVTRDLSDFVGQPAMPTVADAARLVAGVGDFCRVRGSLPTLRHREQDLQEIVGLPAEVRVKELQPLTEETIRAGLANLTGG